MGYQVKWIEENLGISRKALRNYEKVGLMPPNKNGAYRDYSDEDVNRIWAIRLFQGIGYTLKELVEMSEEKELDFPATLEKKISELEEKKEKIERNLGYAQAIKLTGKIPVRPIAGKYIKFKDFQEQILNTWNINNIPDVEEEYSLYKFFLDTPEEKLKDTDIGKILELFEKSKRWISQPGLFLANDIYPSEILKRKERGTNDSEIQLLVKMIYETRIETFPEMRAMTPRLFARFEAGLYRTGETAKINENKWSNTECEFLSDAIAVFGGYKDFNEIET